MSVLIDLSQVMLSNLFAQIGHIHGKPVSVSLTDLEHTLENPTEIVPVLNESLIRHMILNSLRMYKQKFSHKYGKFIICVDSRNYWRKKIFPFYKANRRRDRTDSGFDWKLILETLTKVKNEIREFFPYKVVEVDGAEADDIIGTLVFPLNTIEKTLILSGDKDFQQLLFLRNVEQFSPIQKQFLTTDDPKRFLKIHIMKGDAGDGIPNFLSPNDTFVNKKRQIPLKTKNLELWSSMDPEKFCTTPMLLGFYRNETLIDLTKIPKELKETILNEFKKPYNESRKRMFDYFVVHKMKHLLECINEF
jgi:5'-3' exonuclease